MKTDVIFFHGAGAGAYDADSNLADSLAKHLGVDYIVTMPRMPEVDTAGDEEWSRSVGKEIDHRDGPVVLVGHSAGGYQLLKHLAAHHTTTRIAVIAIIAAPFPGGDENWTFDGFELSDELAHHLPADAGVLLDASEDDDVVPFAHRDLYAAALPQATTRTTSGGHQLGNNLRMVANDIRRTMQTLPDRP
jgi:uncharacterized protein